MQIIIVTALVSFGVWLLFTARELNRLGFASYRWRPAEGTIVESFENLLVMPVLTNDGGVGLGRAREMNYIYEYVVDGRTFRSSNYCFGTWLDTATAAYLIGTKVKVFYDPQHPEMAVPKRGLQFGAMFGVVPIGIAILFSMLGLFRSS